MLLKVLQRELVHKLPHFTSQGIENVLWAFATLGHHPGQPVLNEPAQLLQLLLGTHLNLRRAVLGVSTCTAYLVLWEVMFWHEQK